VNAASTLLARALVALVWSLDATVDRFRRPTVCPLPSWFDAQEQAAKWRANVDAFDRLGVKR
jgi:hypothetical protein